MAKHHHICFNVADRSYLALIKKDIHNIALESNFSQQQLAEIDIIVAELTSNLIKYSQEGQLLVKTLTESNRTGIELLSIDKGPGIADVNRMMEDGVSTGQTLGSGLGAIKRLADEFHIYTVKSWGTTILVRVWTESTEKARVYNAEVRSVIVPKPGETDCGDAMSIKQTPQRLTLFLADALGHGKEAQRVALAAVKAFEECTENSPVEILRYIHEQMRKTRGLVGTVATFDYLQKTWKICGVGNITCRIGNYEQVKTYLSYNGIIGMNIPTSMNDQETAYMPGQMIFLCSDGLKSRLELYKTAGIYKYDASVLSAALYKDYGRQTDDMSIVIGKLNI